MYKLHLGNCLDVMKLMPDNCIDSIVTDPPYGISFMGKKWDYDVPSVDIWKECFRVLKPGGHLLSFAGTRTQHRMAVNIEDAGFEIRDLIAWMYSSGFPKSLDISKAIDKAAGAEREVVGRKQYKASNGGEAFGDYATGEQDITAPATDAAKQWAGWGTALKPAFEPITVARKPFNTTVAANVLEYGTGGLNVDGCRVEAADGATTARKPSLVNDTSAPFGKGAAMGGNGSPQGHWPANFIHDGSEEVVGYFPDVKGGVWNRTTGARHFNNDGESTGYKTSGSNASTGSAARFFYCAKASKRDRNEGMSEGINTHSTVKPTTLMRYLCRLITPPNGLVLDPFMGSGSTGKAAILEGFNFEGIDLDEEYLKIAEARIKWAEDQQPLLKDV